MKRKITVVKVLAILFFLSFMCTAIYILIASFIPSSWVYEPLYSGHLPMPTWFMYLIFTMCIPVSIYSIAMQFRTRKVELGYWIALLNKQIEQFDDDKAAAIIQRDKYQKELDDLNKC